jgi:hypothetical protein
MPIRDYGEGLPNSVPDARSGRAGAGRRLQPAGPAGMPVIVGPELRMLNSISDALCFMRRIDDVSFILTGEAVDVPPAGSSSPNLVTICEVDIDEGYNGFLTHIGMEVLPTSAADQVLFQILVVGGISPKFSTHPFRRQTLQTPLPFTMWCEPKKKFRLVAQNLGANKVAALGMLIGFERKIKK